MIATERKFEIGQEVQVTYGYFLGQIGTIIDIRVVGGEHIYKLQFDWGKSKPTQNFYERHLRLYS